MDSSRGIHTRARARTHTHTYASIFGTHTHTRMHLYLAASIVGGREEPYRRMMGLGRESRATLGDDWDEDAAPICDGGLALPPGGPVQDASPPGAVWGFGLGVGGWGWGVGV